jgi:hypothetical protein
MEIEKTFLPIQWSEKNLKLIRSFDDSLTSRPEPSNHKGLSIWQQKVIEQAEIELFPMLDYVSSIFKQPLYFNLHLLLIMPYATSYDEITVNVSKDHSICIAREYATEDALRCCCSHPITACFIINGQTGYMLCGSECISKNNFVEKKMIHKLKREIKERDMTPEQRVKVEEKIRVKQKIKEEKRIQKKEEKRLQIEEEEKRLEDSRIESIAADNKRRLQEIEQRKYNFENSICNTCQHPFNNQGKYNVCYPCKPKCVCGNVINPPFKLCFECNQKLKKDICVMCKKQFDGKGKYVKCYSCN